MKILENKSLKIILVLTPAIIAIVFIIMFIEVNNEFSQAVNKYKSKVEKLDKEKDELTERLRKKEESFQIDENTIALDDHYINEMKEKGLSNPVQDIISDLQKHRELIPYKGILGGEMGFYYKNEIRVLTNKWVLAYFEDGHYGGYLLLEYLVHSNGKITWKRIAAMRS